MKYGEILPGDGVKVYGENGKEEYVISLDDIVPLKTRTSKISVKNQFDHYLPGSPINHEITLFSAMKTADDERLSKEVKKFNKKNTSKKNGYTIGIEDLFLMLSSEKNGITCYEIFARKPRKHTEKRKFRKSIFRMLLNEI